MELSGLEQTEESRCPIGKSSVKVAHHSSSLVVLLLALMLVVILQLTAFAPLACPQASVASGAEVGHAVAGSDDSQPANIQKTSSLKHARDWRAISDEKGSVDVLLLLPSGESTKDVKGSLVVKISQQKNAANGAKSAALDSLVDQINSGTKREYNQVFQGVSLSANVDSIEALEELCPSIRVYPDNQVKAYLTGSIRQVGAEEVWSRTDSNGQTVTGKGVIAAIIDTGVDYMHPDLGGGIGPTFKVIGGYDFTNGDSNPMDDNGHGTHVAGILGGNGVSFKGVAPDVKIIAYKALGADGYGRTSDVIAAIERAMDPNSDGDKSDHVDIISMSLGSGATEDDPLVIASESAISQGIVVVAAAGNEGPSFGTVGSPAIAPDVIAVGAIDGAGVLATFSSRGTGSSLKIKPEICAPGVYVNSTVPYSGTAISSSSGYKWLSGTSMAAPHVSGTAALLIQLHPSWTPALIRSAIIAGTNSTGESVWFAGAGNLWVPKAADASLLVSEPVISYTIAGSPTVTLTFTNMGPSATISYSTHDFHSLAVNGTADPHLWVNLSSVGPSSGYLATGASATISFSVGAPTPGLPEGYFEGELTAIDGGRVERVPFGYAALSRLNVHVIDMAGNEVEDPYGWVGVYSLPSGSYTSVAYSNSRPSPPAGFLLPEGTYAIHSAGHGLIYRYKDPFMLSGEVTLGYLETKDVYLRMSEARKLKLDLLSDDGVPIYAKDFRMFVKRTGQNTLSIDLTGYDSSQGSDDLLYLPTSKNVYVSNTTATVGISFVGYSYSPALWDFFTRNWLNWYQFSSVTSTRFYIESTADQQYYLSWEFPSVGASTPDTLTLVPSEVSVYDTKYDIPGTLAQYAGVWGATVSAGGQGTLYLRRDTDCPINPFFSGMTRRTYVQGVFSEMYLPGDLYDVAFEREHYLSDYGHSTLIVPSKGIYLPDRDYLSGVAGVTKMDRTGAGPFYPSVYTENTNSSMSVFQPLLRDAFGAKVIEPRFPSMTVNKDGSLLSSDEVTEYMAEPDAYRIMSLAAGSYEVVYSAVTSDQICSNVTIKLGFRIPAMDVNPPQMTGLEMSQRFVPGQPVSVVLSAKDASSLGTVEIGWRSTSQGVWNNLAVNNLGGGRYGATVQTSASDSSINLRLKVSDTAGNYIEYTAANASLKQRPVSFALTSDSSEVEFGNVDRSLVLTGYLRDSNGAPLSAELSVPLELKVGSTKVAMILDDYLIGGSRVHNGTIRYEWHFNPAVIFSGPNQVVNLTVSFDLGLYAPASATISLRSVGSTNSPPVISLKTPLNNSLFASGQIVDIDISDDGTFTASAYLDSVQISPFTSPWQVSTSSWSDGKHLISVVATDNLLATSRASYSFEADALSPSVTINYPREGDRIPMNSVLTATVTDARLYDVAYSIDNKSSVSMVAPYRVDLSGLSPGPHSVAVMASDIVGHTTTKRVNFTISASPLALQPVSPANNSVVRSGTLILFSASGSGSITYRWSEGGIWHDLGVQAVISTSGWQQGVHSIIINATSSLGGWDQIVFVITIDDFAPDLQLQSPANGSFVSPMDSIAVHVDEDNIQTITWTIWGVTHSGILLDLSIPIGQGHPDGAFYVRLVAIDRAGNEAGATFNFNLDSSPPALSMANLLSGEVAKLGSILDVNVADAYLTTVLWALDDGQAIVLVDPYEIDTSSFSVGWHSLRITATDASGKQTILSLSMYLDNASPVIGSLIGSSFSSGSDFSVSANITDDYAVGQTVLYYELKDGTYASVPMDLEGGYYVAVLPADVMWDGMEVYVSCKDVAGNEAIGAHSQLVEVSHRSGLNLGFLSSLSGIAIILAAAMISSISLLYASKRKGKHEESREETTVRDLSAKSIIREEPVLLPTPPKAPAPARTRVLSSTARMDHRLAEPRPARDPMEELEEIFLAAEHPKLIDSIPERIIKPEGQEAPEPPVVDYGDLIEKELLIPGLKNSVFKEEEKIDLNAQIELQLEELRALIRDKPKKPLE